MSKDPELSRLKAEMDRLFEQKQLAYQEMKHAGKERANAKDDLDAAWDRVQSAREEMNNAFEERQRDWDDFKSELNRLSYAIDEASNTANYYHEHMQALYDDAHNAHASVLADYRARKAELQGMTIYDRQARNDHIPTAGAGYMYVQGEKAGYGHSTQSYSDGYRLSRSTNDGGKTANQIHWTNQNSKKGSSDRHLAPIDTNY